VAGRPIMIVGISRRSGTNFLSSVLLCHRDCAAPAPPVVEDHLLRDAPVLERYAHKAAQRWPRRWGDREEARAALEHSLGDGLLAFLASRSTGARPVSRTPRADNLHLAATFYMGADLVLLVRDGRSVVASLVQAWHWTHDRAIKEWRRGARAIIGFERRHAADEDGPRFIVVRYEDLLADFEAAVDKLLSFAGLDPVGFDYAKARNLPIVGSSYIRDEDGKITFKPVARTADFDPSVRFAGWPRAQHERFNWLAGSEQRALGYPTEVFDSTRIRWAARNLARDASGAIGGPAVIRAKYLVSRARERRADHRWHAARAAGQIKPNEM
jgi:hypothetical protein